MKIIRLSAENIKRLRAVEITPDGNTVVISGGNGQGKTSVLDAIAYALAGVPTKTTPRPVRDGADSAEVVVDLGDLVVTRSWTAGGKPTGTLKVTSKTGAKYSSPQQMLDQLIGRLSFDPLEFARQAPKDQRATLLALVDLPFDPAELDAQRAGVYDQRTVVNRRARELEATLARMAPAPDGLPTEEIQASELLAEYRAAQEHHQAVERAVERRDQARERVLELRRQLEAAETEAAAAQGALDAMPAPADLTTFEQRLAQIDETNRLVRYARERAQLTHQLDQAKAESAALTERLAQIDADKADALAAANMPIDGLEFTDQAVTYRGVPFAQCSAAEQLRVSLAIAMALNPAVRVIRITDASLLDAESMRIVEEMAADRDYQVWLEVVDETGQLGVYIEDGQVANYRGVLDQGAVTA